MTLRTHLLLVVFGWGICLSTLAQPAQLANYNVVWKTPSKNSSESMPCGGGDVGLNVWVEDGDVLFYLSQSGTFDENNAMLKLGRVRLRLSPNPFTGTDFKQELRLQDGGVYISGGKTRLHLWVDVFRSVVHAELQSDKAVNIKAAYESWRYEDRLVQGTAIRENSYKTPQKFDLKTYKDEIAFRNNELWFYHRNRDDVPTLFDFTVQLEGMESVKSQLYNPIKNNTFGGAMRSRTMRPAGITTGKYLDTDFKAWNLETPRPVRTEHLEIVLNTAPTSTLAEWENTVVRRQQEVTRTQQTALAQTHAWWKQFWERSYIFIEGKDSTISRNYHLFRYQLGCNAFGQWPTKFNGGLFTFDPQFVDKKYNHTPDFRLWGGGTMTAQNQRLVYFPMLKSGDFELMKPQFDFYLRSQTNAELRSKVYWNHNGACFTEQIENFGLPNPFEYGYKRPEGYDAGMEYNAWLEYQWDTVFEFCLMMLETERYEGRNIQTYVPFIESCLTFFDEHYQGLAKQRGTKAFDEKGQYVFYPSSACETYKMTYNSTTVISALKVILTRMLELPDRYLSTAQRQKWMTMLERLPPLPLQEIDGHKTLAPAVAWMRVQNSEAPQLYPVFPWGLYGVGNPELEVAQNTYRYDPHVQKYKSHVGWRQHNIFAARLGLVEEAAELTRNKFKDADLRFPTFWGPGFDWTPDHNWGGSAMIGLQEMLLQTDGRKIVLLPAWPKDWNATFKLHAPYQTTIEGRIKNGVMEDLKVTPASRLSDVIVSK